MPKFEDLTGRRYGLLTVIGRADDHITPSGSKFVAWVCRCDCGIQKVVIGNSLRSGRSKSCGCMAKEIARRTASETFTTHGESKSRLYGIWAGMRKRCYNESCTSYPNYGGRGVRVCDLWSDFGEFRRWSMENGYANNLSIDRVDVNGDYSPDNCRWADVITQSNNRRGNVRYVIDGEAYTIAEISAKYGIRYKTLWRRLKRGWSIERAIGAK